MKRITSLILTFCLLMSNPLSSKVNASSLAGRTGDEPEASSAQGGNDASAALSQGGGGSGTSSAPALQSSFAALWKAEQAQEEAGKPQSAYAIVQTILKKAEAGGHRGQALSARMRAASLHQEWAPDSFFTDVAELEALRNAEQSPEAQAIYASILAQVYEQNRYRSQASRLQLDSDEMKEWTQEQYDSAAAANWRRSLQAPEMLAKARSKDWLPFVEQNKNSAYFNHDLLHILWRRCNGQRQEVWGPQRQELEMLGNAVAECYHKLGNREAELLVRLDGTETSVAELRTLAETFADLPVATEVYLRLIDAEWDTEKKVEYAQEALRRYPQYSRIGEVQNRLNALRQPYVSWTGNRFYYPGKEYEWCISTRNTRQLTMTVYRLHDAFSETAMQKGKLSVAEYFRQNADEIAKIAHSIEDKPSYETASDTLKWTAPKVGRYGILFEAKTDEKEARQKSIANEYDLFNVSALKAILRNCSPTEKEIIVVDAETGHPVEDAEVQLYIKEYKTGARNHKQSMKTNAEGRARFRHLNEKWNYHYAVAKGEDCLLPEGYAYNYDAQVATDAHTIVRLYTDRAIYRPGQTVHLGGIAYRQEHWEASPIENHRVHIVLRDANWKEVATKEVMSDEMGVFSADFVLPQGGLPGYYHLRTGDASTGFRVEEYKRPTFEVTMDEAPALQWPQDSITLTGRATGFNGVPVRSGRVTGTYRFTYPYSWWYAHDDSPRMPIDTVHTDENGSFRIAVPLKEIPQEALHWGLCLALDVEVLSAAGETRAASQRVPLSTTPLRMNIALHEQQDRDRLTPPAFHIISSTAKPTEADVEWEIASGAGNDKDAPTPAVAKGTFHQGTGGTAMPDEARTALLNAMRALPSGEYHLRAIARAGNDSAKAKAQFFVFGMNDTRLPREAKEWLYCPTDTFDLQHPARLQVGSSLTDVALYFCLVGKDSIVEDRLIRLSDELRTIEIPYLPHYGDGVTASFAFVKEGELHTMSKALRCPLPDKQLRWQWTTFRDRLHPGDKEQWTLRITQPDGSPASANLMATIYDASLDQLYPHHWNLALSFYHHLRYMRWSSDNVHRNGNAYMNLNFPMKTRDVKELLFDDFDPRWTIGLSFYGNSYGMRPMRRLMRSAAAVPEHMEVMEEAEVFMAKMTEGAMTDSAETEETVATAQGSTAEADEEAATETVGAAPASLRTNFNETAAFFPRLQTDANGEVTLAFTLPESLTTWQLLGVAHDGGMMTANVQAQAVAQKEMMAQLYLPRFLRAGDRSSLRATVQNLTEKPLSGKAKLEVFDPETERVLSRQTTAFEAEAKGEATLAFDYTPSEKHPIVAVRLMAESRSFSDGEQRFLAILPAKEWVTESVEIRADSLGSFTTDLSKLFNHNSSSATQRRLTIDYTTHPIWNVVQALPALRETASDDVLSITSVLYANILSAHIAQTTPRLHDVITLWKQQSSAPSGMSPYHGDSTSPLAKDEALKQLTLEETPWLAEALSDTERRAQLIDLFDESLTEYRLGRSLQKLQQRQLTDGSFSWFPGMRGSELMTRLVAIELTRLRTLTNDFKALPASVRQQANTLLRKAFAFVATANAEGVQKMKEAEKKGNDVNTGALMHLHYVYIAQRAGVELTKAQKADVRYLLDHLKGSVAHMSNDERAVAAIVLKADGRKADAQGYFDSMREHLTTTPDHGTFFDYAGGSFTPTSHKVVIHTSAIEAAEDLAPGDTRLHAGLRRWLLQQKRTQMWESSVCTTNAIYALLHSSHDELNDTRTDQLKLHFQKGKAIDLTAATTTAGSREAAALGHIRQTFTDGNAPASITVVRNSQTEAWGAVYAQYLTPVSDAGASANGLNVRQEVSATKPALGERLTTHYIITADRDYEYVCLRAGRPACAEPAEQLSGYRYQGGLGYYRAVRDAHTDYFFDHLPKGTYVIEETAFVDRTGRYSTGLTTLRCLYAPEYGANTPATELTVK